MILGQNKLANPSSSANSLHNNLVESRLISDSRDRRVKAKPTPSKDRISSLEYSILMNHPEIDS